MSVSIVTINLNNGEGLERTLGSLARRTCPEFELIVVDGGSTGGSLEVCDRYQKIICKRIVEADNGSGAHYWARELIKLGQDHIIR